MTTSGPTPISTSAIQAQSAKMLGKQMTAKQVASEDDFIESVDTGFNPAAVEREQARRNRSRTLTERKGTEKTETKKIKEVAQKSEEDLAHDFQRRNPELEADTLFNLRQSLTEGDTAEDVLKKVSTKIKDPTLADEVMEYLERTTAGDLLTSVQQARKIHFDQNERVIVAGRNVDSAAKWYYQQGLGKNPTELRDLYRDITGNPPRDHNVLFAELSTKYAPDQLKIVVAFLLKGLTYDLKSKGSSIEKPELMRLMTETRNLQSILGVHLFFESRMRPIQSLFAKNELIYPPNVSFRHLAQLYMQLVEGRYPSFLQLSTAIEKMGFTTDEGKSIILHLFFYATGKLSPRLYQSPKHLQNVQNLIRMTIEDVEAEEEGEEA